MSSIILLVAALVLLIVVLHDRRGQDRPTFPAASVDRDRARVDHDLLARRP